MIKAVIFDLDGTVTRPFLDFGKIRSEIGAVSRVALLEQIENMPADEKGRAHEILKKHEIEAAAHAEFNPGMPEVLEFLNNHSLRVGIITRNCEKSTSMILDKLGVDVDDVITRESGFPPKPAPDALLSLCERWGIKPSQVLMVGDHGFDVGTGAAAGSGTVFLTNGNTPEQIPQADYSIDSPAELMKILKELING